MRKPMGDNNKEEDKKEDQMLPSDRFKALGKDAPKDGPEDDPSKKPPILEREKGLFILWVQEKINNSAFMTAVADKDEEISVLRALLAASNQELAKITRKAAGLQKENAELFRQLFVGAHKAKMDEAGFVDGARLEEMPDGRFILLKPQPPVKGK